MNHIGQQAGNNHLTYGAIAHHGSYPGELADESHSVYRRRGDNSGGLMTMMIYL